jgi:hypothetical protein
MDNPGRTILYYPTIDIPTGTWLRQALIYWDQVGSIVPRSYDDWQDQRAISRYNSDIQYLYEEEVFRPFNPDALIFDQGIFLPEDHIAYIAHKEFIDEFKKTIDSEEFKKTFVLKSKKRAQYKNI